MQTGFTKVRKIFYANIITRLIFANIFFIAVVMRKKLINCSPIYEFISEYMDDYCVFTL